MGWIVIGADLTEEGMAGMEVGASGTDETSVVAEVGVAGPEGELINKPF